MSHEVNSNRYKSVEIFWHNYLSVLEKFSIPVKARPRYWSHLKEYISSHQSVKLHHHLPQQIDEYLVAKDRLGH